MKPRILLALLALALVPLTAAVGTSPATGVAGFGDVEDERYFTVPVQWMVDNQITTGTSPTCFSPSDPVTRGQAAAFLWRMENRPTGYAPHPFTDVSRSWQQEPVSWMAAEGITTGTSDTTYSPNHVLTRGQMAALLYRAAGEPPASATTFPDVVAPWQIMAVGWLEQERITEGTTPTTFSPNDLVTRGQFAAFAYRWSGSPAVEVDPASPACAPPTTTTTTSPSTSTTTTIPTSTTLPGPSDEVSMIDWWGCWRAEEATDGAGQTPGNGQTVAVLPNCASGPSSVGAVGNMSHPTEAPIFRPSGANGHPSIEFTFAGNTLLQTNGGTAWSGSDRLDGASAGVTVAWIGMITDVESHSIKYMVSGLSGSAEYPQLIVEGEGPNRFIGWAGSGVETHSPNGTVTDNVIHGVIMHFAADGSASSIEVDGDAFVSGQDTPMGSDVAGLTLGNIYSQNFSTTDHQFVFLGLHEGALSEQDRADFWAYLAHVREG